MNQLYKKKSVPFNMGYSIVSDDERTTPSNRFGEINRRALGLVDGCGRTIDHLRLSVTSRCDLRCMYCRPNGQASASPVSGSLTDQRRLEFVRFVHKQYGISQVRITGGEPLLYPNVVRFIADLKRAVPDVDLAMTTNGRLLYDKGFELLHAGLDRLNISLDSIKPQRYREITGADIEGVLKGIESARFVGFHNLKINTVVLRGVNDNEIIDLAIWALSRRLEIRFLEAMPIGPEVDFNRKAFVSGAEVQAMLAKRFQLDPLPREPGETAQRFRATCREANGVIGLIAPVSEPFCGACRRMRLTAEGLLYPCLLDNRCVDIRPAFNNNGFSPEKADLLIRSAVASKGLHGATQQTQMVRLGG